jgi:hypothetical protein
MLVGNKADIDTAREVSFEEGMSFAEREHLHFIETSALTGRNIAEAVELLTAEYIARYERGNLD